MVFFFICAAVLGALCAMAGAAAVVGSIVISDHKVNTSKVFALGALALVVGIGVVMCGQELAKRIGWERESSAAKEVK